VTDETGPRPATARAWLREHSELGVCVILLVLGALVLTDALTMDVDITQRGPVGPRTVPIAVGAGLLAVAVLLAVDVLRGGRGEAEGGEDVDLAEPADRRTDALRTPSSTASARRSLRSTCSGRRSASCSARRSACSPASAPPWPWPCCCR